MTHRPRLRLALPPLTPREALTLSYLFDTIDNLLWAHYGDEMVDHQGVERQPVTLRDMPLRAGPSGQRSRASSVGSLRN